MKRTPLQTFNNILISLMLIGATTFGVYFSHREYRSGGSGYLGLSIGPLIQTIMIDSMLIGTLYILRMSRRKKAQPSHQPNTSTIPEQTYEERQENHKNLVKRILLIFGPLSILMFILFCLQPTTDHYETGVAEYGKGQYADAASEFQSDVRLFPYHSLGYYYLGKSLEGEGRPSEAAAAYQKASEVESASDHPDTAFAVKCQQCAAACRTKTQSNFPPSSRKKGSRGGSDRS